MFHIVLVHPEIPPNTGNIIRLSANTGACLHLVEPLGFSLGDKHLRRAGLDYHEYATVHVHASLQDAYAICGGRRFAVTGGGGVRYDSVNFVTGDAFVFGAESTGLSADVLADYPPQERLFIPMRANNRSLNLSNAVAVVILEAWRQQRFAGAAV